MPPMEEEEERKERRRQGGKRLFTVEWLRLLARYPILDVSKVSSKSGTCITTNDAISFAHTLDSKIPERTLN